MLHPAAQSPPAPALRQRHQGTARKQHKQPEAAAAQSAHTVGAQCLQALTAVSCCKTCANPDWRSGEPSVLCPWKTFKCFLGGHWTGFHTGLPAIQQHTCWPYVQRSWLSVDTLPGRSRAAVEVLCCGHCLLAWLHASLAAWTGQSAPKQDAQQRRTCW